MARGWCLGWAWRVALLAWAAAPAAGAPWLQEQGAVASGVAGSGVARVLGPASAFHNPAVLVLEPGSSVEVGAAVVAPLHEARSRPPGVAWGAALRGPGQGHRSRPTLATPPAVFAAHASGGMAVGVAVFSPLVLSLGWPGGWPGRTEALVADTKVLAVNPVVAWRLGALALGGGLTAAGGYRREARVVAVAGGEREVDTRGGGAGLGVNAGVALDVQPGVFRLGAHYRSRVVMGLVERVSWGGGGAPAGCGGGRDCPREGWGVSSLVAPDVVSVGVQATPFPTTTFSLDLGLALWSLTWGRPGWVPGAGLARASGVGRLEDGVGLRAGVEQALPWVALDVVLRGGLLVEKSPVPVRATRGDQPWGDRVGGSAGAGWRLFGLTLDAAYVGDVTVPRAGAPGGDAQFWSTTHMAVVSVGYRYAR